MTALTHNARAGASIFTAGASHQLRDATRRGMWLYPPRGPKTPPLGYPIYLLAQVLLPLSVALWLRCGAMPRCGRGFRGEVVAVCQSTLVLSAAGRTVRFYVAKSSKLLRRCRREQFLHVLSHHCRQQKALVTCSLCTRRNRCNFTNKG